MRLFDLHTDTCTRALQKGVPFTDACLHAPFVCQKGERLVQVAAIFPGHCRDGERAWQVWKQTADALLGWQREQGEENGMDGGRGRLIWAVEDANLLDGREERLEILAENGVKLIGLTWNYSNGLGDGALEDCHGGLTFFGKECIRQMTALNMAVDLAHSSENTFWQACREADRRGTQVLVSHSNVRRLCDHPRNLTDEQIRELVKRKALLGICLYPPHLHGEGQASVEDVVDHMAAVLELGGEDCLALGTDFDGVELLPTPLIGRQSLPLLRREMARRGIGPVQTD